MKKTYITPSIKEVKALKQDILGVSNITVKPTEETETMDAKKGWGWSDED